MKYLIPLIICFSSIGFQERLNGQSTGAVVNNRTSYGVRSFQAGAAKPSSLLDRFVRGSRGYTGNVPSRTIPNPMKSAAVSNGFNQSQLLSRDLRISGRVNNQSSLGNNLILTRNGIEGFQGRILSGSSSPSILSKPVTASVGNLPSSFYGLSHSRYSRPSNYGRNFYRQQAGQRRGISLSQVSRFGSGGALSKLRESHGKNFQRFSSTVNRRPFSSLKHKTLLQRSNESLLRSKMK